MDDAQARRWLTSLFDGAAALTVEQIREGARLCADVMDAQQRLVESKQGEDTAALLQQTYLTTVIFTPWLLWPLLMVSI